MENKYIIGNTSIFIEKEVLELLKKFMQTSLKKNESGGILFGQLVNEELHVFKATIPTNFDKSSRRGFIRSKKIAQIIIDYEHFNSQGKTIYLGEWHTHSEEFPTPSSTDIQMITNQYKINILNSKKILLVIIGTKGFFIGTYDGSNIHSQMINY